MTTIDFNALSTEELLHILAHGEEYDRCEAAKVLPDMDRPRIVPALIEIVRASPDTSARKWAAHALGYTFDIRAKPALLETVRNTAEDLDVRCHAVEALGCMLQTHRGQGDVREALRDLLQEDNAELRFWAAYALGNVGISEDLPALQVLADSDHRLVEGWWPVSREAAEGIEHIRERARRYTRRSTRTAP